MAVALLLLTLSLSVAAVRIGQAHRQTLSAMAGQEAALQNANEKTRIARQAADAMYRDIPRQEIASTTGSRAVQRRLLESALSIYQQLSQDSSPHPSARLETGLTLAHMHEVLLMSGREQEAIEAAEQAIHVLSSVSAEQPDKVEVLAPLGALYHDYAFRLVVVGRAEDAIAANLKAAAIFEKLLVLEPEKLSHEIMLASIESSQAESLRYLGRLQEAASSARRAWESAFAVARKLPEVDWEAWSVALNAAGNLASILAIQGRIDEAEQVCRQAVVQCESLRSECPDEFPLARTFEKLQGSWGGKLFSQGRLPAAEAALRAALATGETLLEAYDDGGTFLSHAQTQIRLGQVLRKQGKTDEAITVFREALGQLMARHDDHPNFQGLRASGEWELARLLRDRDLAESEQHFRITADLYGSLLRHYPQDPRNHVKLGQVRNNLGCLLVDKGDLAAARQTFEAAIEHEERALELRPDVPKARHTLNRIYANLSLVKDAGGARIELRPVPEQHARRFKDARRLHVTVSVHGRTRLALQHDHATWEFMPTDAANEGLTEPESTPPEVCMCGARIEGRSDLEVVRKTVDLATSLPSSPCEVQLETLQSPGTVRVVQHPDVANDQRSIIEFDGADHESACTFIVLIDIVSRA